MISIKLKIYFQLLEKKYGFQQLSSHWNHSLL